MFTNESLLQTTLDSIQSGIIRIDSNWNILLINHAAKEIFNFPRNDAAISLKSLKLPNKLTNLIELAFEAKSEQFIEIEQEFQNSKVWFQHKIQYTNEQLIIISENINSNRLAFQQLQNNILKKKQAVQSLLESERSFRLLFDTSPVSICVVDLVSQTFIRVNNKLADLLNIEKES